MRRTLVSAQMALSLALVVGVALFARSLDALASPDASFSRQGLVAMDFDIEPASGRVDDSVSPAREALEHVRSTPGIHPRVDGEPPGVIVGLVLCAVLAYGARTVIGGVSTIDPVSFIAGLVAVTLIVALASFVPCRQATRIDPAIALKE